MAINIKTPINVYSLKDKEKITAARNDNNVPTEAVQIIAKIMQGIKAIKRTVGERNKRAPTKVANPLPPLNPEKHDQL